MTCKRAQSLLLITVAVLSTSALAEKTSREKKAESFDFDYLFNFINPFAKLSRSGNEANERSLFYYFGVAEKPASIDQEEASRKKLAQALAWPEDTWKPKGASNIVRALYQWSERYLNAQQNQFFSQSSINRFTLKETIRQWAFPSPVQAWVSATYIDLYTGPNGDYPAFYIAEKHQILLLLATQADWVKVQVEDGTTGWVKDQNLLTRIVFQDTHNHRVQNPENKDSDKATRAKRFIHFGLNGGLFDAEHMLNASAQVPLFENISLSASLGEVIGVNSDAQILEVKLRHQPDFQLPVQTYFSFGSGHIFNASFWAGDASLWAGTRPEDEDANFISVGMGLSYPLSSRLSVSLDASNYHAFFSDAFSASFQAYSLGIHFQNDNRALAALEKSADKLLKRENRMLGAYIGQYKTESGYSSLITGLTFIYLTSPNSFIDVNWGQGELDTDSVSGNNSSLSYYRFMLAYIAHRSEYVVQQKGLRTQWYLLAGPGSIRYENQPSFTTSLGAGLMIETGKRAAFTLQAIDQMVDSGLLEKDKITHNPELSIGINLRF